MNDTTVYILIGLALLALGVFIFRRRKSRSIDVKPNDKTPRGINIVSSQPVSDAMKSAMDESLTNLFNDARALGYTQKITHGDYTIHVRHDCVRSPESGTLSFKIRADEYNNSIFDVNPDPNIGEVLAAEQVITHNNFPTTHYIICADTDLENVRKTTRYGAEHIILAFNDPSEYERTKFHGNGIYHPIIPTR